MESPDMAEMAPESADTLSPEEGDLSRGYRICVDVLPSGYRVSDPEPLPAEPLESDEASEGYETVPDLTTALKHLLAVIKENPLGANPNEELEAGYASGPGAVQE